MLARWLTLFSVAFIANEDDYIYIHLEEGEGFNSYTMLDLQKDIEQIGAKRAVISGIDIDPLSPGNKYYTGTLLCGVCLKGAGIDYIEVYTDVELDTIGESYLENITEVIKNG